MSTDCLFCRMVRGEVPVRKAYEDGTVLAFYDIAPQAPVHILIIPKVHIASVTEVTLELAPLIGHLFATARQLAEELKLSHGFRLVLNTGPDAGQAVLHLHLHLLGGRAFTWPPG